MPLWTRGGRELVFEGDGGVMAVDIDTHSGFHAGTPRRVFELPLTSQSPIGRTWTCSEDGQRFFVLVPPRSRTVADIEIATDFGALVNRK